MLTLFCHSESQENSLVFQSRHQLIKSLKKSLKLSKATTTIWTTSGRYKLRLPLFRRFNSKSCFSLPRGIFPKILFVLKPWITAFRNLQRPGSHYDRSNIYWVLFTRKLHNPAKTRWLIHDWEDISVPVVSDRGIWVFRAYLLHRVGSGHLLPVLLIKSADIQRRPRTG